jgi:hypothetical protein
MMMFFIIRGLRGSLAQRSGGRPEILRATTESLRVMEPSGKS